MSASMPTPSRAPQPPGATASLLQWTRYQLAVQSLACSVLGSRLYQVLLAAAAADVERRGPAWTVLQPHATRTTDAALALRFMAAIHRLVLTRQAPQLALFFPSVGGSADAAQAWPALRAALIEHRDTLTADVGRACQTNEVGRCAALAGGFLTAAARDGLPLRLLEIGTSGGLNLRWDRYFYADTTQPRAWGDQSSPVQLRGVWQVPAALCDIEVEVTQRLGCDPAPVDPLTDEGRLALTASVWGDQLVRFERLRGALQLAATVPVDVTRAGAGDWLPQRLRETSPGAATVVFQSVVMQYLDADERDAVVAAIAAAGRRATAAAPLYWLRMEPDDPLRAMSVHMTRWPGNDERLLATAGAHGDPVRWGAAPESEAS